MKENGILEKIKKIGKEMRIWVMVGIIALMLFSGIAAAAGTVHNMNTSEDFISIQAAIDNASDGDEIHVDSGTYYENVNINKRLILKGIDTGGGKPIVDASKTGSAIILSAGRSTLEGFSTINIIDNWPDAGIRVYSNNNIIKNNFVSNSYEGISLYYSSNNTLSGNNASNNSYEGIYLEQSSNNILSDNDILNNGNNGIYIYYSTNNSMSGNNLLNNSYDGIYIYYAGNSTISGNDISGNSNNGIYIYRSSNNILSRNNVSNNYNGVYLGEYGNNILSGNSFSNNSNGIFLDSTDNILYHNNFISNINYNANDYNAINEWDNGSEGNFWSDYTGTDANSDGIGDTPYNIDGGTAQDNYPLMSPYNGTLPSINNPPNQPTELKQYKSDGTTEIFTGGTTNERTVIFKGLVSDPDGDQVRLEVELRRTDENNGEFNESMGGTKQSPLVANGTIATASAVELINSDYHWRARTIDEHGNASEWQDYGGNSLPDADFTVNSQESRIAHITDPHLGYYVLSSGDLGKTPGMEKSVVSFTDKLQDIKGQNVEQIVVTGDLVQDRKPEFFMAFKNLARGFNVNTTPGNHDRRQLLWGNDLTNYQNIIRPTSVALSKKLF